MRPKTALAAIAILAIPGWLLLRNPHEGHQPAPAAEGPAQVWTCSMHPQIRRKAPGACPICGMDLTPAAAGSADGSVTLSEGARRIASIEVQPLAKRALEHEVRTVGRMDFRESQVAHLTARVDGRVERLYADFTGTQVSKGDHLVDFYSPDLLLAQEEYLVAVQGLAAADEGPGRATADRLLTATRQKLLLWGLTDAQLEAVVRSGKASITVTLHAPRGGTVIAKSVKAGTYVKTGDLLYTIADLSVLWLHADLYEYELPWVQIGQPVQVEAEGAPGERFEGTVAFVDPVVNEASRTVRVRVELPNPEGRLKPGMFAKALIRARLGPDGRRAPSPLAGRFACPMHPEVVSDAEGGCRICGMPLQKVPGEAPGPGRTVYTCPHHGIVREEPGVCDLCGGMVLIAERIPPAAETELLALPATAVLDTGTRKVAYVEEAPGSYRMREVTLGPRAGDFYPVLSGLAEGDRVVVHGNFLLDSQAQIEGKPSLLFPKGLTQP